MGKTIKVSTLDDMCRLMRDNTLPISRQDDYDACYHTGIYEDYACELCPHNFECSGCNEED